MIHDFIKKTQPILPSCFSCVSTKNLNTSSISSSFQIGWWKILNILSSFSGWCQCWHDKNEWNSWGECRRFWCHSTSRCYKESAKQLCEGHRAVVSCWYVTLSQQLFSILKCFLQRWRWILEDIYPAIERWGKYQPFLQTLSWIIVSVYTMQKPKDQLIFLLLHWKEVRNWILDAKLCLFDCSEVNSMW